MLNLFLRRLMLGLVTVVIVSIIIFLGVELLPGDACTAFLEREAQGKLLENCRNELGLGRPAYERYLEWAAGAAQGDLGILSLIHISEPTRRTPISYAVFCLKK